LPPEWKAFKIAGPLFFAAADRVFGELAQAATPLRGVILLLDEVPLLDAGGLAALNKLVAFCIKNNIRIYLCDLQAQPQKTLTRAKFAQIPEQVMTFPTLNAALHHLHNSPGA
jgi:SulP family sulfate permease